MSSDQPLAHIVYFSLKDDSQEAQQRLADACQKYLSGHDGTTYFSVGTLVPDLSRDVNQRDWQVALHVIFANRAAHDVYQTHERHLAFIEENKNNWAQVRVFDADVKTD